MKWRLIPLALLGGVILVGSPGCSPAADTADRSPGGAAPAAAKAPVSARSSARPIQRGRFADAVQVGKNRWMLIDDEPPPLAEEELTDDGEPAGGGGGGDGRGRRGAGGQKKRFGQSPIYVDGVPVAVATYGELPAWLATRWVTLNDGRKVIRFVLADYLAALGVPLRRVQAVHFYGGRGRVGILPGRELRRVRHTLLFSFTQGNQGKMRMHWRGDIDISDSIDKVQTIAVYVDRPPPRWDREAWGLVDDEGSVIEGIPYAEAPLKGGVRIYLDGRIAHVLKRNRTFERKIEPARFRAGVPSFQLFDYLDGVGVDARRVVAVELLSENRVALRLDGRALAAQRGSLELSAPPQSSGRIQVHLGAEDSGSIEVTALNLYTSRRARAHERRSDATR
jgi:hypothetical protein